MRKDIGLLLLGAGVGAMLAFTSPPIGIPIGIVLALVGILLIVRTNKQVKGISEKTKALLTELSKLKADGASLLVKGLNDVKNEKQAIEEWWQAVRWWECDVTSKMLQIHPADPDVWKTLGKVRTETFMGITEFDMNHKLTMLSMLIDRLGQYIDDRTRIIIKS